MPLATFIPGLITVSALFPSSSRAATAAVSLLAAMHGSFSTVNLAAATPTSAQAEDPNIRCAANRATSVAIPFERIYPKAEHVGPSEGYVFLRGPRILAVVSDSTMWPAVWHAAVDSVTTAPVAFGDGVIIIAATQSYPRGPTELRIVSIRQCRATGVSVVTTLETRPHAVAIMMYSRGLDVVHVAGRVLAERSVLFDQRVMFVPER